MEQFDKIIGEFRPRKKDDLKPWAKDLIGLVFEWEAMWIIESGPYKGEWAMIPRDNTQLSYGWVPSDDICVKDLK